MAKKKMWKSVLNLDPTVVFIFLLCALCLVLWILMSRRNEQDGGNIFSFSGIRNSADSVTQANTQKNMKATDKK